MKKRGTAAALVLAVALLTGCGGAQSESQQSASSSQQEQAASAHSQSQAGTALTSLQPSLDNYSVAFFQDRDEEPGASYFRTVLTAAQHQEIQQLLPGDQWQEMEPPEYGVTMLFALGQESGEEAVVSVSLLQEDKAMVTLHPMDTNVPVKCWSVPVDRQQLENFAEQLLQTAKEKSER